MKPRKKKKTYRSGLEQAFRVLCDKEGFKLGYETTVLPYVIPPRKARYLPDWTVKEGCYLETKGRLTVRDRKKMLLVKEQHPDSRILIVFQRPENKIYKNSKVSYGEWATDNGFEWCSFEDTQYWIEFIRSNSEGK